MMENFHVSYALTCQENSVKKRIKNLFVKIHLKAQNESYLI